MKIMKYALLVCILTFGILNGNAQIKNAGFELRSDTLNQLPKFWHIRTQFIPNIIIDSLLKFNGTNSLKIASKDSDLNHFIPFSQVIPLDSVRTSQVKLSSYIKANIVIGSAGLWCQIWDNDNKMIGFQNLEMQNVIIDGTFDWKKYSLNIILNDNAKKLLIGGYLKGSGEVWYDDFNIENVEISKKAPTVEVVNYITNLTKTIQIHSLYSDLLNWQKIKNDVSAMSNGLSNTDEAQIVVNYMLAQLRSVGDNHSFLMPKKNVQKYQTYNGQSSIVPTGSIKNGNIGYISVPSFASTSAKASSKFAKSIQTIIADFDMKHSIKGWIVDLRENSGGNMYPMIAGLGPLFDNTILGYFITKNGGAKKTNFWFYKNGVSGSGKINSVVIHPYKIKNGRGKIAILIGNKTASSGEMTAISFLEQKGVKFFGQPTSGYTTGNEGYKLRNGDYLYLATSEIADRNRRKIQGKIQPDTLLTDGNIQNIDTTLKEAISWINIDTH